MNLMTELVRIFSNLKSTGDNNKRLNKNEYKLIIKIIKLNSGTMTMALGPVHIFIGHVLVETVVAG